MTNETSELAPAREDNDESLRLFIAIPIPGEIKAQAVDLAGRLRKGFQFAGCRLAWLEPEAMHLTLRFLGDTSPEKVEPLAAAMQAISERYSPLEMKLGDIGVFPNWRAPRVLWVGVSDKTRQITELQREIEAAVIALGFKSEGKEFHAHLTLARFKSLRGARAAREIVASHRNFKTERFIVPEAALFESVLRPEGAKHLAVKKFLFGKKGMETLANQKS